LPPPIINRSIPIISTPKKCKIPGNKTQFPLEFLNIRCFCWNEKVPLINSVLRTRDNREPFYGLSSEKPPTKRKSIEILFKLTLLLTLINPLFLRKHQESLGIHEQNVAFSAFLYHC
jgi:hypothetical protein